MKYAAFVFFAFLAFVVWAGSPVSMAGDGHNLSSVNGSVVASPGETYGTLSTVNGNVRVGRGATADNAKTVNGEIVVENEAKLGEANTVNGSLDVGDDVAIERTASTVNGGVELGKRTHVGGDVSTVSGEIEIKGAEVGGRVTTRNGDIDLTDGARVRGGILVKKPNDNGWRWNKEDPLKVHICGTCVVEGELRFERPVELRVDQGAKIGNVVGDQVTRR
jgi:predicted acyltransferase (DUF342 family)